MASLFVKGMIGGALDEATERNRRRDDASEAMTTLAIDNINEARKIQAERESLNAARNRKAKSLGFIKDIDMAKAFLNDFDPDNSKNPLELETIYRDLVVSKGEKLAAPISPTVPLSGATLPTETTGGTFGDMFKMPTTMDAFTSAEKKLGLKPGEGAQYYETATQAYNPNVLSQEFSYTYSQAPETGVGAVQTGNLVEDTFVAKHGGVMTNFGPQFDPVVTFSSYKDDEETKEFANNAFFGRFKGNADSIGNHRSDKYRFAENAIETQANQNIRGILGEYIGAVQTGNDFVSGADSVYFTDKQGNLNTENFNFMLKGDQTGGTQMFFELAQTGIVPYEQIVDVLANNNDVDAQSVKRAGLVNAAIPRPAYSYAQLEAIALDSNLDEDDFMFDYIEYQGKNPDGTNKEGERIRMTLKEAQERWDAADAPKRNILETLIGPEASQNLIAGIYGSGNYKNIESSFDDVDDGLSGTYYDYANMGGTTEKGRSRLRTVVEDALRENYPGYDNKSINLILDSVDRTTNNFADEIISLSNDKLLEGYTGKATLKYKDGSTETGRSLIPMEYTIKRGDPDAVKAKNSKRHYRWLDIESGEIFDSEYNQLF